MCSLKDFYPLASLRKSTPPTAVHFFLKRVSAAHTQTFLLNIHTEYSVPCPTEKTAVINAPPLRLQRQWRGGGVGVVCWGSCILSVLLQIPAAACKLNKAHSSVKGSLSEESSCQCSLCSWMWEIKSFFSAARLEHIFMQKEFQLVSGTSARW